MCQMAYKLWFCLLYLFRMLNKAPDVLLILRLWIMTRMHMDSVPWIWLRMQTSKSSSWNPQDLLSAISLAILFKVHTSFTHLWWSSDYTVGTNVKDKQKNSPNQSGRQCPDWSEMSQDWSKIEIPPHSNYSSYLQHLLTGMMKVASPKFHCFHILRVLMQISKRLL